MPIVCHGGFFDPPTFSLLELVLTELHAGELPEVAWALEHWIARNRVLLLTAEQETPCLRRWSLTEWGELVLHELFDIARKTDQPTEYRRHRIAHALRLATGGQAS